MKISDLWAAIQAKILEWLLPLLGAFLLGIYYLVEAWLANILGTLQPTTTARILGTLVVVCILLLAYIFLTRARFTEHRGAFFKRKRGGGYHEVVYCGICKFPTSTRSSQVASYYKCKCGWVSSFTQGEFEIIFKQLPRRNKSLPLGE